MFKPNETVKYCPICHAPLEQHTIDQFGLPVGYTSNCTHCCKYSDIWVNGLREVQCGTFSSPDYQSNYGNNKKEKKEERTILRKLNYHIAIEKVKYQIEQHKNKQTQLHTQEDPA